MKTPKAMLALIVLPQAVLLRRAATASSRWITGGKCMISWTEGEVICSESQRNRLWIGRVFKC